MQEPRSRIPPPSEAARDRRRSPAAGIALRHSRGCASRESGPCSCKPAYQAQVWVAAQRKPIRRSFRTLAEARAWRQETQVGDPPGQVGAPSSRTVREAAEAWLAGARSGSIRTRSGRAYKPSVLRSYEIALRTKINPRLGSRRLSAISRNSLQDLIEELIGEGYAPSSIRNAVMPLRAIFRRALARGEVPANPTRGLEFPVNRRRRDRVASPAEAGALIAALAARDQALWATAIYAGLRRGELQALRWCDVNLKAGVIAVVYGWDREAGLIEPKSPAAERKVPIAKALRVYLLEQRLRHGAAVGEDFVFSATGERPFDSPTVTGRARSAWRDAGLEPVTLHECRHTFASLMIAAGVNIKALSTYMGHSTVTLTLDRYGHLLPGNEVEAASALDGYLDRVAAQSRSAGP
jgi:integrase